MCSWHRDLGREWSWALGMSVFLLKTNLIPVLVDDNRVSVWGEKTHKMTPRHTIIPVFLLFKYLATTFLQRVGKVCLLRSFRNAFNVEEAFFFSPKLAQVPSHKTFFARLEVSRALGCRSQWHNGTHRCMRLACEPSGASPAGSQRRGSG